MGILFIGSLWVVLILYLFIIRQNILPQTVLT